MPKMPCLVCGIPTNSSRCPQCQSLYEQAHPRIRQTPTQRGYDYEWRKIRMAVLVRDNWTCHYCQKKLVGADATVDHLIPVSVDPSLRLNRSNLVSACRSCNSSKKDK